MSTESIQRNQGNDDVYRWIDQYQQTGDRELQLKIVEHYKGLVHSLSRKFSRGKDHEEDLFQVGMVGLLAALQRFDGEFGRSFESFAVPTIVGEIKRFIRDKTWSVHVPRRIKELGPKIKNAVEELTTEYQRSPLVHEIAEHLGVSEEDVLETMEMSQSYQALSVDRTLEADQEGGETTLLDLIGEEESGFEKADRRMMLENALKVLSEREQQIIYFTYYEHLSQKETGERLGISQMHVSRLQRKALNRLKESINIEASEIL
ncbi:RNA polymerase sigma factor SigB [Alkalihalobacillus hemicellulosilyticus]|uniref:RNA polymerase sigma factor n=1 Tax=Halalkalibacter hemicellulosilyticusJCM 9152 TaxID=1236971 RepID=W4QC06_9BACI|nr:RNA polymerase sigma factor SigB [Halalkalibacter hemicellulosilyticus]GAE28904.1 RNA polymerase sigma factor SigB [Halalkalibacter hemicellulosilyticusJCM 9152]